VLYAHPAVAEAAVVGLSHKTRGQMIKAYIVLREGARADEAELKNYMREHMSAYSVPHAVVFRDAMPKSMIGKILKKELLKEEM
jgi:long-chain acyl-CoA synthetase